MATEKTYNLLSTCHTGGCENENIPIASTTTDRDIIIICGPCMQYIDDIVEATDKV